MVSFSFRAKRDRAAKWGPKGRRIWRSDCSFYQVEEHLEYEGVKVPRHRRFVSIGLAGPRVLGHHATLKAAKDRCSREERQKPATRQRITT